MASYRPLEQSDGEQAILGEALDAGAKSQSREVQLSDVGVDGEILYVSGASEAPDAEQLQAHGDRIDLDEDVYGAAIFTLTFDSFELLTQKDHDGLSSFLNKYRMAMVLLLLLGNYLLQFMLLYWIYSYVALPAQHGVQKVYKDFHARLFVNGKFSTDHWNEWDDRNQDELCSIAFVNFEFMYGVIIVWWMLMLSELRKTERDMRKFSQIPTCTNIEHMIIKADDMSLVVRMTSFVRRLLWWCLLIPKFVIAFALTAVGTVWLAATDSYSELILNAVALGFIVQIDEHLFNGLLPESIKDNIGNTKLLVPKKKVAENVYLQAKDEETAVVGGFKRSTMYLVGVSGIVFLFMTAGQNIPILGVFPLATPSDIEDACPAWFAKHAGAVCHFGKDCFPIKLRDVLTGGH